MEPNKRCVIGVDVGGTKIAAGLITSDGVILHKEQRSVREQAGVQISFIIQTLILQLIELARQSARELRAVGISVPGIYFARTGHVWAPNIAGWEHYPLRSDLQSLTDTFQLPVFIDSDRAAYILGETWLGAAQGSQNAIYLAIGTGIGAGILSEGRVLRGAGDIAGAVGWFGLTDSFREEYARCGNFEYYASGEGLVRMARELLQTQPNYQGVLRAQKPADLQTPDLFTAYDAGDVLAQQVMERAIQYWGKAAANLISTFNPEVIVFGGGVFGPAQKFLSAITAEARRWAQPISMQQVRLTVTSLGADAGLLGAAAIALQED